MNPVPAPALVCRALVKRYPDVVAIDGLDLEIAAGECFGLLGPNGAGKTSTLRLLYGLMRPDAGSVRIDEVDVVADPLAAQAKVGVLPDAPGLYPRLSAREHVRYFGELQRLRAKKPVIACMGNVAASGGYYVAVGCDHIVAQPTTTTGSIGVISARVLVAELCQRAGIRMETVRAAPHADMLSPFRALDDAERTMLQAHVQDFYDTFLNVVAAGRQLHVVDLTASGGRDPERPRQFGHAAPFCFVAAVVTMPFDYACRARRGGRPTRGAARGRPRGPACSPSRCSAGPRRPAPGT